MVLLEPSSDDEFIQNQEAGLYYRNDPEIFQRQVRLTFHGYQYLGIEFRNLCSINCSTCSKYFNATDDISETEMNDDNDAMREQQSLGSNYCLFTPSNIFPRLINNSAINKSNIYDYTNVSSIIEKSSINNTNNYTNQSNKLIQTINQESYIDSASSTGNDNIVLVDSSSIVMSISSNDITKIAAYSSDIIINKNDNSTQSSEENLFQSVKLPSQSHNFESNSVNDRNTANDHNENNSNNSNNSSWFVRMEENINNQSGGSFLYDKKSKRETVMTSCLDDDFNHRLSKKFKISDDT